MVNTSMKPFPTFSKWLRTRRFLSRGAITMTGPDKRLVLRGMSIAEGILIKESCDHLESLRAYQMLLADA
jgi:hypothetical protein